MSFTWKCEILSQVDSLFEAAICKKALSSTLFKVKAAYFAQNLYLTDSEVVIKWEQKINNYNYIWTIITPTKQVLFNLQYY